MILLLFFMVVFCDIFSVPLYCSREARKKEWLDVCQALARLGLLGNNQFQFIVLNHLVFDGYLSAQSASHFLSGRASSIQVGMLKSFIEFKDGLLERGFTPSRILQLWQKNNVVEMENTFLFPLAELASSEDFSKDIESYENVNLVELQNLK